MCSEPFGSISGPSEGAPLGIYGKSQSIVDSKEVFSGPSVDPETVDIRGSDDPSAVRLERFALQAVVRSILPAWPTAKCLRVPFRPNVDVLYSPAHQSASFGGLVTCASVWNCPICAAKITERRRVEIQAAIAAWEAQGGSVALLTLTHGHTLGDRLADLLKGQQKALTRFFGGRSGQRLMDALGRRGQIRAWEVTHGRGREINNGWHPHFHILLFLDQSHQSLEWAEDWAFTVWVNACRLAGLPLPNRRHGVTLQDGAQASSYVAKMGHEQASTWGLDSELTKGHIKRAGDKGETPFDLLRSCLACDDPQGRKLFFEYAQGFRGKRQLVWSRGLRELLDLDVVLSDAELAAVQEEDASVLAALSRADWRVVLKFDARGEVLELARHGDAELLLRFIARLRGQF